MLIDSDYLLGRGPRLSAGRLEQKRLGTECGIEIGVVEGQRSGAKISFALGKVIHATLRQGSYRGVDPYTYSGLNLERRVEKSRYLVNAKNSGDAG